MINPISAIFLFDYKVYDDDLRYAVGIRIGTIPDI